MRALQQSKLAPPKRSPGRLLHTQNIKAFFFAHRTQKPCESLYFEVFTPAALANCFWQWYRFAIFSHQVFFFRLSRLDNKRAHRRTIKNPQKLFVLFSFFALPTSSSTMFQKSNTLKLSLRV